MLTKCVTVSTYELFARAEQVSFIAHDSNQLIIQAQRHSIKKTAFRENLFKYKSE